MCPSSSPHKRTVDGAPPAPGLFERIDAVGAHIETSSWVTAMVVAVLIHFAGGSAAVFNLFDVKEFAESVQNTVQQRLAATIELDEPEPEPEAEPEPEPEPLPEPEPEPEPEVAPPPPETTEPDLAPPEAAPPAAAEAGQILAAEPDPSEPLDLTDQGFVTGPGTNFSGGVTARDGTSKKAVRDRGAKGGGIEGSKGKTVGAPPAPAVDLSRPAGLPKNANWSACSWPAEAASEQMNTAYVRVVVIVSPSGRASSVNVLSDPGFGFGRMAKKCAMRHTYSVGLDKKGKPKATATPPFRVKFAR